MSPAINKTTLITLLALSTNLFAAESFIQQDWKLTTARYQMAWDHHLDPWVGDHGPRYIKGNQRSVKIDLWNSVPTEVSNIRKQRAPKSVESTHSYTLEELNSFIGDPEHQSRAISPINRDSIFIDESNDVVVFEAKSKKETTLLTYEYAWQGSSGHLWLSRDQGVMFVNNGENAISITTDHDGGKVKFWDATSWEDITRYFCSAGDYKEAYVKVSPNTRYAALSEDGPKFGGALEIVDFKKERVLLLMGMSWIEIPGEYPYLERLEGIMGCEEYKRGYFSFGFTPDSKYLVIKKGSKSFTLYDIEKDEVSTSNFETQEITDPRYTLGDPNDPEYHLRNPKNFIPEHRNWIGVKIFQKAMKNERLDILDKYFDYPHKIDGMVLYSTIDFVNNFDKLFPLSYREEIASATIAEVGSGIMLGRGILWFQHNGQILR